MHISDYGLLRFIMNNATALQQLISHSVSEIAKPPTEAKGILTAQSSLYTEKDELYCHPGVKQSNCTVTPAKLD